jgi:UDP-N-acetyl-D-galactosamine dehydrogenase
MKDIKIAVVGLGYVGLPLALAFAKKTSVIGFDIHEAKLDVLRAGTDPNGELDSSYFEHTDIHYTNDLEKLKTANIYIVAVPTPIDKHNNPDLAALKGATTTVAKVLKKGDLVVYESTVYPGCTEEDCVPILEKISGLGYITDFKVGYSPERINPGDKLHMLHNTTKIVSGCDAETLQHVAQIYKMVVDAPLHHAPSIKVAEAAKIIENTQRDLNIALMNELSIIFNRMNIDTREVIEAAGTKWNFMKYYPGLVGGHCIGVDPYYLTYKANEVGFHSKVILAGRSTNDTMGYYVGKHTAKKVLANAAAENARVLILGATFKENVSDIRNSKVVDIAREIQSYNIQVDMVDAHGSSQEFLHEYNLKLDAATTYNQYDAVIVAVAHTEYTSYTPQFFYNITKSTATLVDVKGIYDFKNFERDYWRL